MNFSDIDVDLDRNLLIIEGAPNSFFFNIRKVVVSASYNGLHPFKSVVKINPGNAFFPLKLDLDPPFREYTVTSIRVKAIGHRYKKSEQYKEGGKKAVHPYRLCVQRSGYAYYYP